MNAAQFNIVVAPCVSPWGYETINRWNLAAVDPNRSLNDRYRDKSTRIFVSMLAATAFSPAPRKLMPCGEVLLGMNVQHFARDQNTREWTVSAINPEGERQDFCADPVISSAAIADLVEYLEPGPLEAVLTAAWALRYREFLTVALIVRDVDCFDDNWIYIHDGSVKVGRIQNYKSWSPHMVPDPDMNCLGMEYFCFKGAGLWDSKDEDLIRLADEELIRLGLVSPGHVIDG